MRKTDIFFIKPRSVGLCFFKESVSVFLRRHSFLLVEGLGKVKAVVKAEGVGDRGDRQVGML